MPQILATSIPLLLFVVVFIALTCLFKYWEWSTKKARKKSPLTRDLLRGPGESLRLKIDDMTLDLIGYMTGLVLVPLMIYSVLLSAYVFGTPPGKLAYSILIIISTAFFSYLLYKIIRQLKLRRRYVLGLEAEVAVGQELNLLMREGYWVYHDFPADKFNIDHILAGPNGVFAVETKGRPKQINKDGSVNGDVLYDGKSLRFPSWTETKSLLQSERQARWLAKWLSSAVGETVNVQPVLVLPGWFIKGGNYEDIAVINGKNPYPVIKQIGKSKISAKLLTQIAHNLDQRCRNVLPRAYKISND